MFFGLNYAETKTQLTNHAYKCLFPAFTKCLFQPVKISDQNLPANKCWAPTFITARQKKAQNFPGWNLHPPATHTKKWSRSVTWASFCFRKISAFQNGWMCFFPGWSTYPYFYHWFPLIGPYKTFLSRGGFVRGGRLTSHEINMFPCDIPKTRVRLLRTQSMNNNSWSTIYTTGERTKWAFYQGSSKKWRHVWTR